MDCDERVMRLNEGADRASVRRRLEQQDDRRQLRASAQPVLSGLERRDFCRTIELLPGRTPLE